MAKITKILALTLVLNLVSLQPQKVHSKEAHQPSGTAENPSSVKAKLGGETVLPNIVNGQSEKPTVPTSNLESKDGKPVKETEQPGSSTGQPSQPDLRTNKPVEQPDSKTQQPVKSSEDTGVNTKKQDGETMELKNFEIGLYNAQFEFQIKDGMTKPDSCKACVLLKNSETCCEGDFTDSSKNDCLEKTFDKLSAGTEYKLNICNSDKAQLFSHTFKTKNIPRLKHSTYNNHDKIITYKLEYVKSDDVPDKCTAVTDDKKEVKCLGGTTCSCTTGIYNLTDAVKDSVIRIVDPFDSILYHFNKDGQMPDDPSFYKFKVSNKKANSVAYSMSQNDPDINENKICKFKNLAGNTLLKCQTTEGGTSSNNCICTGGNLVELSPLTKYNVEIKNENDKLIYHKVSFKTARVLRELEQIIGMNKYKYTIKDIANVDRLPGQCKMCIIEGQTTKRCCKSEITYTGAEICTMKEFSESEIRSNRRGPHTINICDNQGNQIATDSFLMPGEFKNVEFVQSTNGLKYQLSFNGDKKPTICKLKYKTESSEQQIELNCIKPNECDCSSGEVSLPANLSDTITITIEDFFNEKIVEKPFTLNDSNKKVQNKDNDKGTTGKDERTVETREDKPDVDSSSTGSKDSGLQTTNKPDGAGTENSELTEEDEEGEEEKEEAGAENKETTDAKNTNSGPKDSQTAAGGPVAPTEDSTEVSVPNSQPAEGVNNGVKEASPPITGSSNTESGTDIPVATGGDQGSQEEEKPTTLPTKPAITVGKNSAPEEKEGAAEVSLDDEDEEEEEVVENAGIGIEEPITVSTGTGIDKERADTEATSLPETPPVVGSEAIPEEKEAVVTEVKVDSVDDDDDDDDDDEGSDEGSDIADKDGKPVTTTENAMKVAEEAKKIAEEAKASANEAKKEVEAVIEAEDNSNPELIIPILTDGIDASAATPVNTDDGHGSIGSNSGGNDPIMIAPQPPIISNPNGGGITTGEGDDKTVNTINNGGSANGSTNDRDKDNVSSTGGNHVPDVKPTTSTSSDAQNPATNTTTTTVPSSDDVKKPGSDGGDTNDQGLSSGAIIGIIVGVMVLAGSIGGISYYMIRIKGRASYV